MKRLIVSALFAGFAATAGAQQIIAFDAPITSTRTRADVLAEVSQAAANGKLYRQQGEITWAPKAGAVSTTAKTRADVLAEVSRAAASGELYRQQGEITWLPEQGGASSFHRPS